MFIGDRGVRGLDGTPGMPGENARPAPKGEKGNIRKTCVYYTYHSHFPRPFNSYRF